MPQMMPLYWMIMFLWTLLLLIFFMSLIYYIQSNKVKFSKTNFKKMNYLLLW